MGFFSLVLLRFPFDCKNPVGYLIAIYMQYNMIWYMFYVIASLVSLGIGAFIYSVMGTDEIKRYLNSVNEYAMRKKNHLKSLKQLAEYVDYHSEMKQLSTNDRIFSTTSFCVVSNFHKKCQQLANSMAN